MISMVEQPSLRLCSSFVMVGERSSCSVGSVPHSKKLPSTDVSALFVFAHLPDLAM